VLPTTHVNQRPFIMSLNAEAGAALVFLILYTILLAFLLFGYFTRRLRLRSRYSVILFHVTIRLASQATGLAFGVVGYANTSLLVGYFILGGELSRFTSSPPTASNKHVFF
jgi:hypothetical protein